MEQSLILRKLQEKFGESVISTHSALGEDTAVIAKSSWLEVARYLREESDPRFNVLMDLTAVDFAKRKPRFEVVYHFLALPARVRLRIKVPVGEPNPEVDTLSDIWKAANWYEREAYDMFGIVFRGHPDLRRILMYPEFEDHPLRKDYPINKRQPIIGPRD